MLKILLMGLPIFSVHSLREEFPALKQQVFGKELIYFDNAATSQKPKMVLDTLSQFYALENANIHRGVHHLSQEATTAYENARISIQQFIGAKTHREIIFTKGTTDGINLVAYCLGEEFNTGDEILISAMEHHSNIVPWQMLCERKGCKLKVIPISKKGELDQEAFDKLLNERTKLLAITHISNTLGTINPIKKLIDKAHQVGAKVLIDGAQSIQHLQINVSQLNCDFFVFSGHKVFGPTGIGVLYGKEEILDKLPPYQGGGDMISKVTFEQTTYNTLPLKFEAGTPHIAGAIGLGSAIEFLKSIDLEGAAIYEQQLTQYAQNKLAQIEGIQLIGLADEKTSVVSFTIDNMHPFDIGTLLDKQGIAVRTGHHCTQPLMDFYQIVGTVRASFAFYNTHKEIDTFIDALKRSMKILA